MFKKYFLIGALSFGLVACGTADIETSSGAPGALEDVASTSVALATATVMPTVEPTRVATPTATLMLTATPELSPTATLVAEITPTLVSEDDSDQENPGEHPVAADIAAEFGVGVSEVEDFHAEGVGYGILAQFYGIAYDRCGVETSVTVEELIALHQSGVGMGEIREQYLGHPSARDCNLGSIRGNADHESGGPPEHAGSPDHAGPPENPDNGNGGPPPHAGPPENPGNGNPPAHAGPPDHAGPPADRGNGKKDK